MYCYSDPGISEKRKETKIFIERFLSHTKKDKALKGTKKNRRVNSHKHLQKHKTKINNNSISLRHASFMYVRMYVNLYLNTGNLKLKLKLKQITTALNGL